MAKPHIIIAVVVCALFSKGALAQQKPLDYTFRGVTYTPSLMADRVDRREDAFKQEPSLSLDAKTKTVVIPALEATDRGVTTKIGIRPKKDGLAIRVQITW